MADQVVVDLAQYWDTFTQLKKVLLRNVSLLSLIMFPLTYQVISVEFFVEEQSPNACNYTHRCPTYRFEIMNGSKTKAMQINPNFQIDFEKYSSVLVTTHFVAMCIGILSLGFAADRFGRRFILFGSLVLVFVSSLLGSFFVQSIKTFIPMRILAAFGSGGALLAMFVLAAEYVHTRPRPLILISLWLASTLSLISFAGLAYVISSRKIFMLSISLPLLLTILFYSIIPESPRWLLSQTVRTVPNHHDIVHNESETLLHKFTTEEASSQSQKCTCCSGYNTQCVRFVGSKEQCRTLVIVGVSWFAVGMLYRGLNTSSIQLLNNYYANYAVRELVNLLAFSCSVLFVTCTGRRITTVLSMVLCGIICLIFSFGSYGFFLSAQGAIKIVVQFVGRMFVVLSITSLSLYSIELFPTVVRCTALGIVVCNSFLGAATTPLIMKLQSTNPTIPLAILGSLSVLVAIFLRIFLPETKGALTAESLEDTVVGRRIPLSEKWSPRIAFRKKDSIDGSSDGRIQQRANSDPMEIEKEEGRFKDLGESWDVSFDRASRTSKWEWLSYDDARRKLPSLDLEVSLQDESKLFDESDFEKLRDYVPGNAWILLYSTYDHGISLKTLYHRLHEIETPVLLAIKDHQDYVFGAYSPVPPHVQPGFFGIGKSFFFKCKPKFQLYPNSGKNEYYLHCEADSLAFGCSEGTFGLWLDNELYRGRSTPCETFNSDVLSSSEDFVLIGLEVWTFA